MTIIAILDIGNNRCLKYEYRPTLLQTLPHKYFRHSHTSTSDTLTQELQTCPHKYFRHSHTSTSDTPTHFRHSHTSTSDTQHKHFRHTHTLQTLPHKYFRHTHTYTHFRHSHTSTSATPIQGLQPHPYKHFVALLITNSLKTTNSSATRTCQPPASLEIDTWNIL